MPHDRKVGLVPVLTLGLGFAVLPAAIAQADGLAVSSAVGMQEGTQIVLNGRPIPGTWAQWSHPQTGQTVLGLSDSAWMRHLGGELLNNATPQQQPVQWFSDNAPVVSAQLSANGTYRYLDISEVARQWGWQLQPQGTVLNLRTGNAVVQSVRVGQQTWGRRLVMTLDRAAPWQMASLTNSRTGLTDRRFTLRVDASAPSNLLQGFTAAPGGGIKSLKVTTEGNQVLLQGVMDGRFQPQGWTLSNPPRLVVDIRPGPTKTRRILWAPGLEWREEVASLGNAQFPMTLLVVNPRQPRLQVLPFWGGDALVGIEGLTRMAQQQRAAAAINGGFFSRDRQTPLGAIRQNGTWMSSPILNRGAIGWNAQGQFVVGRLMLQEQMVSAQGASIPLTSSNSGQPQKGIARYTRLWGTAYAPLLKNEQIITLINQQVQSVQAGREGQSFPIPNNGELLVARAVAVGAELAPGTLLTYRARATRPEFEALPNILGAGPLLVDNGRVMGDALAEQFSPTFAVQAADRSAIAQRADGSLLLAVTHNRMGGAGPTLREWAQILRNLGAVNALNLDGGSSTALYLGGQLLDRHPVTAARVHNGIGIFLQP